MLEQFRTFFERIGRAADAQQQREAMIDLLIWMMYADNVLTLPENDRIDQITEEMKWEAPTRPSVYINTSISKIRDVLADEEQGKELLEDIDDRLGTKRMRQEAYEACRNIAQADGQMADEEMTLLNTVKEHFGIDG